MRLTGGRMAHRAWAAVPCGSALAMSAISLVANDLPTEPGIINGHRAAEPVVGVDVYFDFRRPIALPHSVPEPGPAVLAAAGALIPVRRRRR